MAEGNVIARLKGALADPKSRRMLAFGAIAVVVAAGAAYVFSFRTEAPPPSAIAALPKRPDTGIQGGATVSPAYNDALKQADQQRIAEARSKGGSAIPTIVGQSPERQPPSAGDDRPRIQKAANEPAPREIPGPAISGRAPAPQNGQAAQAQLQQQQAAQLAVTMQRQMVDLSGGLKAQAAQTQFWFSPAAAEQVAKREQPAPAQGDRAGAAAQAQGAAQAAQAGQAAPDAAKAKPAAGTIVYATLVGKASTDAPGPVLAEILQGPYAGARLIGSFKTARDSMVISFTKMSFKGAVTPVEAVAVDTKEIGTALATDVDHHYLEKFGIGLASAFVQGLGEAVARSGTTTTTGVFGTVTQNPSLTLRQELLSAAGKGAERFGQTYDREFGNRPTTVEVAGGTQIGILFL